MVCRVSLKVSLSLKDANEAICVSMYIDSYWNNVAELYTCVDIREIRTKD